MRARAWLAAAVLGLVGVLMLGVFPARTLVAQHNERRDVAAQVDDLSARNQALQAQADLLKSDAEIERLARQHYDLVRPGEEIFNIVPQEPAAPEAAPPPAEPSGPGWGRQLLDRLTNVF
ncbi:MAG: septum formation initiator family protein [Acidimicrobiia bacterium]|nr:septum formation initiator family protein [Acidimicrobiia bacterium]